MIRGRDGDDDEECTSDEEDDDEYTSYEEDDDDEESDGEDDEEDIQLIDKIDIAKELEMEVILVDFNSKYNIIR